MDPERPPSTAPLHSSPLPSGQPGSGQRDRRLRANRRVGTLLVERFELLELIGVGAFGEVYRARDRHNPNTPLAVKLLGRPNAQALYAFKREFRSLSAWSHPNLVALHELFLDDDLAFFSMELVRGIDFMRYVRPGGVLDEARLVHALAALCDGASSLHAHGYVHRDLKPSNVLVEPSGRVVVVDLGLATLFGQSDARDGQGSEVSFTGTVHYAAPEQLALDPVGPEADWYAVGTMLYEALSGTLPHDAPFAEILQRKRSAPPELEAGTGTREALRAVCLALLAPDPRERAGGELLRAALGQSHTPARSETPALVGREEELEQLREIFSQVERGGCTVALVEGRSGLGKTSLVDCFLQQLRAQHRAIVLRGRCYVNEEVTYQAVDGSIDALSHHLRGLPQPQVAALLPRDVRSLARLFPVLNRVEAVASAPPVRSLEDKVSLRERASSALRELLARLGDRLPPVVFIDDVQWDDADSAWLLSTLLAVPDPPAMLLLLTCRSEEREHSELLRELTANPATARLIRRLPLRALSRAETLELVAKSLPETDRNPELAERVAQESEGHPLFAIELARFAQRKHTTLSSVHQVSLDDALRSRAAQLSPAAQRLLEIACVAGRPLDSKVALAAAGSELDAWRELLLGKLVTATGAQAEGTLALCHDRVREAVLAGLAVERVCALHAALARALAADEQRFELIVEHYLAAGMRPEAARHALRAADQASAVLAFHRVPALLQLAIEAAEEESSQVRAALQLRLGEAYALVGRGAEAAQAYQDAASLANEREQRWELSSLAMWQAFQARDDERGHSLLHALDAELSGRPLRPSPLRLIEVALRALCWVALGPPQLARRPPIDPEAQKRMRLAFRAFMGLVGGRTMSAFYYAVWALHLSARLGDRALYASMLGLFVATNSLRSGRVSKRDERAMAHATQLAAEQPDPAVSIFVRTSRAGYAFSTAQHERAEREFWPLAESVFPATPFGAFLHSTVICTLGGPLLFLAGRVAEAQQFAARGVARAHERGDAHTEFGLRAILAFRYLANDDDELAWSEWDNTRQLDPAHYALHTTTFGVVPALYAGRLDRAEDVLSWSFRWLFHWEVYLARGRANFLWWWGAVGAARLARGERRWSLRLRVWWACLLLSLQRAPLYVPPGRCLRASRAFASGRSRRGVELLELAQKDYETLGVRLFAACTSHALAQLHFDPAQRALHAEKARVVFESEKIKRPEKWVRALLPGLPLKVRASVEPQVEPTEPTPAHASA